MTNQQSLKKSERSSSCGPDFLSIAKTRQHLSWTIFNNSVHYCPLYVHRCPPMSIFCRLMPYSLLPTPYLISSRIRFAHRGKDCRVKRKMRATKTPNSYQSVLNRKPDPKATHRGSDLHPSFFTLRRRLLEKLPEKFPKIKMRIIACSKKQGVMTG